MNYGRVNSGSERLDAKLQQKTFTPDRFPFDKHATTYGIDGFSEVIINAPENFSAENIKQGVNIAGVTGTYEGSVSTLGTADIKPTAFPTVKNASDDGVDGYSTVTVQVPDNLVAENIKKDVTIAGVTGTYEGSGSGGADAEAEFFKALVTANAPGNPANAPTGLIKSKSLNNWPYYTYVGPDGLDLSNITTPSIGKNTVSVCYLNQYYSANYSDHLGGAIKFGNVNIDMTNSRLTGLPDGEWTIYPASFSSCRFTTDIILKEANVPSGSIPSSAFSNVAKFSLDNVAAYTSLTLTLPANITAISGYAGVSGSRTEKLNLVMLATTPPTVESSNSIQNIKSITVPAGTLEAYQTATNWSQFADIMVEATTENTEAGA